MIMNFFLKQKKMKIEPRIKLNNNLHIDQNNLLFTSVSGVSGGY